MCAPTGRSRPTAHQQRGFSLIELMIGMTLGVILLAGVLKVFDSANRTNIELQKVTQLTDSGQYALQVFNNELHNTGYYGPYYVLPSAPATLPNPCNTSDLAALFTSLSVPVQGYPAADLATRPPLPSGCAAFGLQAVNVVPGSDVLVTRRADSELLSSAPTPNEVYIQSNSATAAIQLGVPTGFALGAVAPDNAVSVVGTDAGGNPPAILKRANVSGAHPIVDGARIAADIRKLHVTIYFVAPCSIPADGGTICTGPNDDAGKPLPTLKRLELVSEGGTTTMSIAALVGGVERMSIEYGLDAAPAITNRLTNFAGDGVADTWTHNPTLTQWPDVVVARVRVLVRSTTITPGQSDTKTYDMGPLGTTTATGDAYKRHLFQQAVTLTNLSQRRQIPQ